MNLGDKIKKRRLELDLTLEEVGTIVGVSKSTVMKWETGYIENMKRDKIALLAKALRVSPLYAKHKFLSTQTIKIFSKCCKLRNIIENG